MSLCMCEWKGRQGRWKVSSLNKFQKHYLGFYANKKVMVMSLWVWKHSYSQLNSLCIKWPSDVWQNSLWEGMDSFSWVAGFWVTMALRSRPRLMCLFCGAPNVCLGPSSTTVLFFFLVLGWYWLRNKGGKGSHVSDTYRASDTVWGSRPVFPPRAPTGFSPVCSSLSCPCCCLHSPSQLSSHVGSYRFLQPELTSSTLASL